MPRQEQCLRCVKWKNALKSEKISLARSHAEHLENRNISQKMKADDKLEAQADRKILQVSCDLQKVLPLPKTEIR